MTTRRPTAKRKRPNAAHRTRTPVRRPRRPRDTDAQLLADAEAVLDQIVARGDWSTATTDTLRKQLESAKRAGVGPAAERTLVLLGTVQGILACDAISEGLRQHARKGLASA